MDIETCNLQVVIRNSMIRIIRKLDIKGDRVKATRCLEGLQDVGDLKETISNHEGRFKSEIFLNNFTASLFDTGAMSTLTLKTVRTATSYPLIVGGGIESVETAASLIESGADRITINTAAIGNYDLLQQLIDAFGAQSIIPSVHVRKVNDEYRMFTKMGRELVEYELAYWLSELAKTDGLEILVTSISTEGTDRGFPLDLADLVLKAVDSRRVILCGGISSSELVSSISNYCGDASFACASLFRKAP